MNDNLPASVLTKNQKMSFGPVVYTEHGTKYRITATARYDDKCGNGHSAFALTADIDEMRDGSWRDSGGGCCHEAIAKHFPHLAPLIKWHLVSADGPMHYIANTVFFAGERDCHGLLKGEFKQFTDRKTGLPSWTLQDMDSDQKRIDAAEKPAPVTLEYIAWGRTGEGKPRELASARSAAVWPEATDQELTAPGLADRLAARLPALMVEFKKAVESLGFTY